MRFAYADPPYLGQGKKYARFHPNALEWDDPNRHQMLIDDLKSYDAWALSLSSTSLHTLLPMCPSDVRVAAWVKPFASFKPGVNPAYCWEPVIFSGVRKSRARTDLTVRDYFSHNITMRRGLPGAKPLGFCLWVLDMLGVAEDDEIDDLFPGTGIMAEALATRRNQMTFSPNGSVVGTKADAQ